uniref:Receptor-like protein kinase FERONIA n=2 Tax=Cajanus cajan TaxID=3821 RepID=A0A151RVT2_CAJCA|nr:Receptor-like protein kinase FERONIA [Cajanus cajan]
MTILFLSTHLQAYKPVDRFTISCGTTIESFDDERTWTGDTNSNLFLSHQDGTVSANATTQSPSSNQGPYTTARLSRSQFNYSFPVSPGPKFLRLFFYPASYPYFPRTDASFTVHSNQFTLLNAFNASLNADAEKTKTVFKEYIINVDGDRLNLSFTPSQPNSYAFINGIEVLSMPGDLYYTSANDTGFKLVGSDTPFGVRTNTALQTEYRIKVGGQGISPRNDTGLFRNWAGHDEDYLIKGKAPESNGQPGDLDSKMNITVNPDYVAPKELYRTARDMDTNATRNKTLKLTWVFPVDSGFTYMLRLHFCDPYPTSNNTSDRKFFVYIGSELAEDQAGVMGWSQKQNGLAVQKNYAVLIPKNDTQRKVNLFLQMQPYASSSNAFLNGVEIFKISEAGSNNLAGPNPQNDMPLQERKRSSKTVRIVVAGVVSGVVLISLVVYFIFLSGISKRCPLLVFWRTKSKSKSTLTNKFWAHSWDSSDLLCHRFYLVDIKAATNNFDKASIVGVGGFGDVYKGCFHNGGYPVVVAIKRLKASSKQGTEEFLNEIEMLSQLRHRHLVSLIGYCNNSKEKILVYRFMTRGNLRDHLYGTKKPPLPWKQRLQICIEAAHGLHYLHSCAAKHAIIHSDVKTTNILLDENWVAKVSDFGLSRIGPMGTSEAHVSTTAVKGSFGYLDPEYCNRQHLTVKSDVYSFGVVLFEVLCARPPLIHTADPKQESLAKWVKHCYQSGTMKHIVDPTLKGSISSECFALFCNVGLSCLSEVGNQRPSMNQVIATLQAALQLELRNEASSSH